MFVSIYFPTFLNNGGIAERRPTSPPKKNTDVSPKMSAIGDVTSFVMLPVDWAKL